MGKFRGSTRSNYKTAQDTKSYLNMAKSVNFYEGQAVHDDDNQHQMIRERNIKL